MQSIQLFPYLLRTGRIIALDGLSRGYKWIEKVFALSGLFFIVRPLSDQLAQTNDTANSHPSMVPTKMLQFKDILQHTEKRLRFQPVHNRKRLKSQVFLVKNLLINDRWLTGQRSVEDDLPFRCQGACHTRCNFSRNGVEKHGRIEFAGNLLQFLVKNQVAAEASFS